MQGEIKEMQRNSLGLVDFKLIKVKTRANADSGFHGKKCAYTICKLHANTEATLVAHDVISEACKFFWCRPKKKEEGGGGVGGKCKATNNKWSWLVWLSWRLMFVCFMQGNMCVLFIINTCIFYLMGHSVVCLFICMDPPAFQGP